MKRVPHGDIQVAILALLPATLPELLDRLPYSRPTLTTVLDTMLGDGVLQKKGGRSPAAGGPASPVYTTRNTLSQSPFVALFNQGSK